jgi:hypothetical protein
MRAFAIEMVSHKVVRLAKCNMHTHQQNQFSNSTEVDIIQTTHYKRRGDVCLPAGALTKRRGGAGGRGGTPPINFYLASTTDFREVK